MVRIDPRGQKSSSAPSSKSNPSSRISRQQNPMNHYEDWHSETEACWDRESCEENYGQPKRQRQSRINREDTAGRPTESPWRMTSQQAYAKWQGRGQEMRSQTPWKKESSEEDRSCCQRRSQSWEQQKTAPSDWGHGYGEERELPEDNRPMPKQVWRESPSTWGKGATSEEAIYRAQTNLGRRNRLAARKINENTWEAGNECHKYGYHDHDEEDRLNRIARRSYREEDFDE